MSIDADWLTDRVLEFQIIGVPQALSARLANLASRPNVQSTLVLSRKDGSIIQATGLLAEDEYQQQQGQPEQQRQNSSDRPAASPPQTSSQDSGAAGSSVADAGAEEEQQSTPPGEEKDGETPEAGDRVSGPKPYEPTHAEAVAAHIFAFISSASALSNVLSDSGGPKKKPTSTTINAAQKEWASDNNSNNITDSTLGSEEQQNDCGEETDVKLLRLRGKVHEIIIIPDRKYLLCVVQDLTTLFDPVNIPVEIEIQHILFFATNLLPGKTQFDHIAYGLLNGLTPAKFMGNAQG
ncbi:hypothetical protein KEM54_006966 [Ascosphaera aggregata]|nr:hypothetical protein KEM54_006966 [Ascosphaera aggregata]